MLRLYTLLPSGIKKIVYPKIETGVAFKPNMTDVYVEAFNNQTVNQDGDESAMLRIKHFKT